MLTSFISFRTCLRRSLVTFFLLLFSANFACLPATPAHTIFRDGDFLIYDLYWSLFDVGTAELHFVKAATDNDHLLKLVFTVRTSGLADELYPIKNDIESIIDTRTMLPVSYTKLQNEKKRIRDDAIIFDRTLHKITYSSFGKVESVADIPEATLDPLALMLAITSANIDNEKNNTFTATDGKQIVQVECISTQEENIRLDAGTFKTVHAIVSTGKLQGVFVKKAEAPIELWFSNDTYRIPLKMRSEIRVGSFYGKLKSARIQALKSLTDAPSYIRPEEESRE